MKRRRFLECGGAFAAVAGTPALAHKAPPFVMPEEYLPTEVSISADLGVGEIHVLPNKFKLYWTLPDQKAIRYTVGVGRPGLYHSGEYTVGAKREWPSWTPTDEMIERDPEAYEKFADGMPGGLSNPLGARALYLFDANGRDTYLRIHGTNNPRTIGRAVSNGCARLTNEHIKELYEKVPLGTRVFLYQQGTA